MRGSYWRALKKIVRRLVRRARMLFAIDLKYDLEGFSISLPPDHLLPLFQTEHPMHERFIPLLAKHMDPGDLVLDIGANCGDTFALMFEQNKRLRYLCVEPDSLFLSYLNKNIDHLKNKGFSIDITCVQALIGKAISNAFLTGEGGTKKVVLEKLNDTPIDTKTIDEIYSKNNLGKIRFIKSDVDGYDYDVLDSAYDVIKKHSPILYFEAQVDNLEQLRGFEETLRGQIHQGYKVWVVFDNYGNLILKTMNVEDVLQIFNYVWGQSFGVSTRTVYYLDILAVCEKDVEILERTVREYTAKLFRH